VVQLFTDELRSVGSILKNNEVVAHALREDLRECRGVVRDALRELVLAVAAQNVSGSGSPGVISEEDGWGRWPQYTILGLLISTLCMLALIADRLGAPRTTVSEFLKAFLFLTFSKLLILSS
jgi:hypothetical protein